MPVTDEQMIWLRAHLAGEMETVERVNSLASEPAVAAGLGALVYAAFTIMAQRKFSPTWSRAQVISFVAQVRAILSERHGALNPLVGEQQLRRALGEQMTETPDTEEMASAQLILLNALVASADLDQNALSGLLIQSRKIADQILSHTVLGERHVASLLDLFLPLSVKQWRDGSLMAAPEKTLLNLLEMSGLVSIVLPMRLTHWLQSASFLPCIPMNK